MEFYWNRFMSYKELMDYNPVADVIADAGSVEYL